MTLTVQRHSDGACFETLRAEWNALNARVAPRTPFASSLWNETWWKHLARSSWRSRDELAVYTVRGTDGQLVAVAPFMYSRRPGTGPASLIELHALGSDPHVTEMRSVLCETRDWPAVMDALRQFFASERPSPTWIRWHNIPWEKGTQWQPPQLPRRPQLSWTSPQPAYVIDLPPSWTTFEATLTKQLRKKIRYCANILERHGKEVCLHVVSDPSAVLRAVHTFYDLVAQRSQVRHADPFKSEKVRAFFDDLAVNSAKSGEFCVFELRHQEKVVAARIGFVLGKELYLYHSGNLPDWDDFSIMTTLLTEIFRWAISEQFKLVNLSTGLDRSKSRWRPREIMYVDAIEVTPGLVNAALHRAYTRVRGDRCPFDALFQTAGGTLSLPNYESLAVAGTIEVSASARRVGQKPEEMSCA